MEKELSIDYYHNVNGTSTFLTNMIYKNFSSPPGIGEHVKLFINGQTNTYSVVDVIYDDKIVIHIQ